MTLRDISPSAPTTSAMPQPTTPASPPTWDEHVDTIIRLLRECASERRVKDRATTIARGLSDEQRARVVANVLIAEARNAIRRETAEAEYRAYKDRQRVAAQAEHQARIAAEQAARDARVAQWIGGEPPPDAQVLKHGCMDKRIGAVLRGCRCDHCCHTRSTEKELDEERDRALNEIIDSYRRSILREVEQRAQQIVTEQLVDWIELLDQPVAVDRHGTLVASGDATVEQLQWRLEMYEANLMPNADGAALTRAQIITIEVAGASTLREAVARGAAARELIIDHGAAAEQNRR
jgi:hypothetical protein